MLGIDGKGLTQTSKRHILTVLPQICKKSAVKHFIEKPMLLNFVYLFTIFCQGCSSPFLNTFYPLKCIFIIEIYKFWISRNAMPSLKY